MRDHRDESAPSSSRSLAALSGASMEMPSINVVTLGERDVRYDNVAQSLQFAGAQRRHQLAGRLTTVLCMRHERRRPHSS